MKIIIKDTTEFCNILYGDDDDYSYIRKNQIPKLIDNYIEYLEDIREDDEFCDNGYLGDIMNLLEQFKNSKILNENKEDEECFLIF